MLSSDFLKRDGNSCAVLASRRKSVLRPILAIAALTLVLSRNAEAQPSFMNFETPVTHPVDLSPDGSTLAVCNLPDSRLDLFSVTSGVPVGIGSVPVGIDPVAVRFRTNGEAWVANQVSDSVSIVDIAALRVVATLQCKDEPADVIFANSRAFVSCSQQNTIQVFDPATRLLTNEVVIDAEDPRAMAISADGTKLYVAIFESGNHSTLLGGGGEGSSLGFPPNIVSNPAGPYGGVNPPPNGPGGTFIPAKNPANGTPAKVGLIVKKIGGLWKDDNGTDWTPFVSGVNSSLSGRPVGWDLPDRDLAVIDTSTLALTYASGLMNLCMAVGVNPSSGFVTVVGTDGTNEIRFEPNVKGKFTRVKMGTVNPTTLGTAVVDLNAEHLNYTVSLIPQSERDKSIGDPRGIVWNPAGSKGYVAGMGSNNLIIIDTAGLRSGNKVIPLGEGPTGIAFDAARQRLYVLNRFEASISVVNVTTEAEILPRVPLHDASVAAIKIGRKHFYDTHKTSGLGQIACASCHVDGRMDRLAWDLGAPDGATKLLDNPGLPGPDLNLGAGMPGLLVGGTSPSFSDFHPMKGPMTTQTFQDIIGHEPFHWRGDRLGLEEFNPAFVSLNGDDVMLTPTEMQEFEDFVATIHFPPNPFRKFDNTLPTNLSLAGHFATGRHGLAAGTPLPNGNPQHGLDLYRGVTTGNPNTRLRLDSGNFTCVQCHTLPAGLGTDFTLMSNTFQQIMPNPPGHAAAPGARHLALVSVDQSSQHHFKTPQIRNAYEKTGFNTTQTSNRAGFGYLHDGSVDSLERFIDEPVFTIPDDQTLADLVSFVLCISGSDLPQGTTAADSAQFLFEPPGPPSQDAHAAVGKQVTVTNASAVAMFGFADIIGEMITLADAPTGRVDLVAHGVLGGVNRGWFYDRTTHQFLSDIDGETIVASALRALAAPGAELTYTVVYRGGGRRIGIDRDEDGFGDRTETLFGSDPADAGSTPIPPDITVAGGPLKFGIQIVERGATASQPIIIGNNGPGSLVFNGAGIAITGTNAGDFGFATTPSTASIPASGLRQVDIVFDPSSPGLKNAFLTITTNDQSQPTVNVPLSGLAFNYSETQSWRRYR